MIHWWRRGAVGLVLALSCSILAGGLARADEQIDAGTNPVVNVQLTTGRLTVRTWDRPQVQIQTDGSVQTQTMPAAKVHPPESIDIRSENVATARGTVPLPSEVFELPKLQGSEHNAVFARGSGNTTVTIPSGTAMVTAHVRRGELNIDGYHGVFVGSVHNGPINLSHVSGTGFVEALHGQLSAQDSTFDRLRARTTVGDMSFRGCTSHQIQATSTYGSILYDNGRFQPGLAHFESVHGNVAIGVRGGAQIGAQSGSGHIVSSFHNNVQLQRSGPNATQATVHGGGPVVTAASHNGSVYLYNGSMRAHPTVQSDLREASGIPHFAARRTVPLRQMPAGRPGQGRPMPPGRYYVPPRRYQPPPGQYPQGPVAAPPRHYQETPHPPQHGAHRRRGAPPHA